MATTDDPALFPEVPPGSSHRLDLVTFFQNAGALPDLPTGSGWDDPAPRGWMASTLWRALDVHFGHDDPARGGFIP
jgi:hypothetical protein